jgi:glycosyltransferase involved in cell wall biosynthesis
VTSVSLDVSAVPEKPAGAGRYIVELARRVTGLPGLEMTLVSRRGDGARWRELAPGAQVLAAAPDRRPLRLAWEQLSLGHLLREIAVEVHHAPHYTMPGRAQVPVVVTIHDLTFFDHPEWHERSKVAVFRRAIRRAAQRADALVCVSEATRDRLVELLRPRATVHVVPHGVDAEVFTPAEPVAGGDAAALARLGVREPYALHVGTLEPRKDVPTLLAAFDRVAERRDDLHLVLAGTPGWGAAEVEARLASMRHAGRVQRLGYVDEGDLPALLRRAGVVAYPSREEGFGLPALEALACGAPLVTTAGTVMGDLVGEAALLVPGGVAAALADALDQALEEAGGGAGGGRSARGLALASGHTWQRSAEEHARIYRAVAG